MSAIARYFIKKGYVVAGYDKTRTQLTSQLEKEGMLLHYEENVDEIPQACKKAQSCLVVYTPAIPDDHKELVYFRQNGFEIQKRAGVGHANPHPKRALFRRTARQNNHVVHVRAHHAPKSSRL